MRHLLYANAIDVNSPTHNQPHSSSQKEVNSRILLPYRLFVDFTNELYECVTYNLPFLFLKFDLNGPCAMVPLHCQNRVRHIVYHGVNRMR